MSGESPSHHQPISTEPFTAHSDGKGFGAWVRDRDGHALQLSQRG